LSPWTCTAQVDPTNPTLLASCSSLWDIAHA
jgi:hypothetical protein